MSFQFVITVLWVAFHVPVVIHLKEQPLTSGIAPKRYPSMPSSKTAKEHPGPLSCRAEMQLLTKGHLLNHTWEIDQGWPVASKCESDTFRGWGMGVSYQRSCLFSSPLPTQSAPSFYLQPVGATMWEFHTVLFNFWMLVLFHHIYDLHMSSDKEWKARLRSKQKIKAALDGDSQSQRSLWPNIEVIETMEGCPQGSDGLFMYTSQISL